MTPHNYSKLRFGFFYFFFLSSVKKQQNINLLKMLFRMFSPPSVPMKCTAQGDSLHTNNGPVTIFNKTLNPICALVFILTQLIKVLLKPPSSYANSQGYEFQRRSMRWDETGRDVPTCDQPNSASGFGICWSGQRWSAAMQQKWSLRWMSGNGRASQSYCSLRKIVKKKKITIESIEKGIRRGRAAYLTSEPAQFPMNKLRNFFFLNVQWGLFSAPFFFSRFKSLISAAGAGRPKNKSIFDFFFLLPDLNKSP